MLVAVMPGGECIALTTIKVAVVVSFALPAFGARQKAQPTMPGRSNGW